MPTGYTAAIGDNENLTFRDFALNCARNFGACIMQRDDPMSDLPDPDEKPSTYHSEHFDKAQADASIFQSMSIEEARLAQQKELNGIRSRMVESQRKSTELRNRYEAMLARVEKWTPPSSEHEGMKSFMRQQITESIKWDCHEGSYWQDELERCNIPVAEWLQNKIVTARHDMTYHAKTQAEEEARVNGRNAWKKALYESLKGIDG